MNFSTYNESSLHNTLKNFYAIQTDGTTEVKLHGHIYDIITKDGDVIEIQTKNLGKLLTKTLDSIDKGLKVKIVHPIILSSRIILKDEKGEILSNRKSPKKECLYDLFKELTGIYPVLLNENFTLEIIEITMIEERIKTAEPVQTKNNRRRFKKNWLKSNKRLEEIISTRTFSNLEDYLSLLPENLNDEFCAKDINNKLFESKLIKNIKTSYGHLILWVFKRMGIIEETEIKNRSHYYRTVK